MTKKQFRQAWTSIHHGDLPWWVWPVTILAKLGQVLSCLVGWHDWETYPTGICCIWCGKKK